VGRRRRRSARRVLVAAPPSTPSRVICPITHCLRCGFSGPLDGARGQEEGFPRVWKESGVPAHHVRVRSVGMAFSVVGQSVPRVDGEEKVTGRTQFVADQEMRGLLHARLFLSPYAHARIRRIPVAAARAVPGVVAVLTADDLPFGDAVPNVRGRCLLARGETRFAGEDRKSTRLNSSHVKISYAVFCLKKTM